MKIYSASDSIWVFGSGWSPPSGYHPENSWEQYVHNRYNVDLGGAPDETDDETDFIENLTDGQRRSEVGLTTADVDRIADEHGILPGRGHFGEDY